MKTGQNLWDVAVMLHGSVEGMFDLLISNEWLNMTTELNAGMELEYHDYYKTNEGIAEKIKEQGYVVANGERHVYHKETDLPLVFVLAISDNSTERMSFGVSGEGVMVVDWGDNTDLQTITMTDSVSRVEHWFDDKVEKRRVRVYGDFEIDTFDAEGIPGTVYPMRQVTLDKFICHENKYPLDGLLLYEGTSVVDLRGSKVVDLAPIRDMSLQTLDLRDAYIGSDAIDDYLEHIVDNYGERRNCTVLLMTEPGEAGMAAIQTIINEESWNQDGPWIFNINGVIYQHET